MLGMDTRAMSKAKMGKNMIDALGSHQNGKHLLGPTLGGEDDELYDLQEEAMQMGGQAGMAPENFTMNRENDTGEDEYQTPMQGVGIGATTSPWHGLIQGPSAGSAGGGIAVTKKCVIEDDENFISAEEMRGLKLEVNQYDIKLKRARLEATKLELEKISPKKTILSDTPDSRGKEGHSDQARRRDMLKIVVPDFKRGDAVTKH